MWKEFKEFAIKGNMLDLAIGVIIGGAFQSIVKSLVNDIIMPIFSAFTGNINFSNLVLEINNSKITYGAFITAIVDFLIIAFSLFLVIRYLNKLNKRLEEAKKQELEKLSKIKFFRSKIEKKTEEDNIVEPSTKLCHYCYTEINYKATKCPNCTSSLIEVENEADN